MAQPLLGSDLEEMRAQWVTGALAGGVGTPDVSEYGEGTSKTGRVRCRKGMKGRPPDYEPLPPRETLSLERDLY